MSNNTHEIRKGFFGETQVIIYINKARAYTFESRRDESNQLVFTQVKYYDEQELELEVCSLEQLLDKFDCHQVKPLFDD